MTWYEAVDMCTHDVPEKLKDYCEQAIRQEELAQLDSTEIRFSLSPEGMKRGKDRVRRAPIAMLISENTIAVTKELGVFGGRFETSVFPKAKLLSHSVHESASGVELTLNRPEGELWVKLVGENIAAILESWFDDVDSG